MQKIFLYIVLLIGLSHCQPQPKTLPIMGFREFDEELRDTIFHTIPDWKFINQNGESIDQSVCSNKIYLAYFFFTTCPSICPKMTTSLLVLDKILETENILLLGHTVNPKFDSAEVLKAYYDNYGITSSNWHLLTGEQQHIYELGVKGYLVPNSEDALEPGGFLHSEMLILVDPLKRIRGFYDATNEEEIKKAVLDLKLLKNEFVRS